MAVGPAPLDVAATVAAGVFCSRRLVHRQNRLGMGLSLSAPPVPTPSPRVPHHAALLPRLLHFLVVPPLLRRKGVCSLGQTSHPRPPRRQTSHAPPPYPPNTMQRSPQQTRRPRLAIPPRLHLVRQLDHPGHPDHPCHFPNHPCHPCHPDLSPLRWPAPMRRAAARVPFVHASNPRIASVASSGVGTRGSPLPLPLHPTSPPGCPPPGCSRCDSPLWMGGCCCPAAHSYPPCCPYYYRGPPHETLSFSSSR